MTGTGVGLRWVVSGGIGSGKSTVAQMLKACGAELFDADAVSRELTSPGGPAMEPIAQAFGRQMLDANGGLDRVQMRDLVFSRPEARSQLEAILHPLIGQRAQELDQACGARPLVFDIPLLQPHSAWRRRAHRVVVVDCEETTQVSRVMQRSGLGQAEVARVMASQITRPLRRSMADAVIFNESLSLAELQTQVQLLWQHGLSRG